MKKKYAVSLAVVALVVVGVLALPRLLPLPSFCALTQDEIVTLLEDDFSAFEVRCLPSTNFGVGTIYEDLGDEGDGRIATSSWLLSTPDGWFSSDIPDDLRQVYLEEIIKSAELGAIDLSSVLASNDVVAGEFGRLLPLSANFEQLQGSEIRVTAQKLIWRQMNWLSFLEVSRREHFSRPLANRVMSGEIIVAAQDLAFEGLEIEVSIDRTLNPEVSVEMFEEGGESTSEVEGEWRVNAKKVTERNLRVTYNSDDPVVVAILYKTPGSTRGEGDITSRFSQWLAVKLDDTQLIEERYTQ